MEIDRREQVPGVLLSPIGREDESKVRNKPKMLQDKENLDEEEEEEEEEEATAEVEEVSSKKSPEDTNLELDDGVRDKQVDEESKLACHKCHRSLAKSRHLIDVAGRSHRWHSECFNCDLCQQPLDQEQSCHIYKDKILCRSDYLKLRTDSSPKCSRCCWPIGPTDWVRRAASCVYHLVCFSCDICSRQLNTGEQFTINGNQLLCRLHFAVTDQVSNQRVIATTTTTTTASITLPIAGDSLQSLHHNSTKRKSIEASRVDVDRQKFDLLPFTEFKSPLEQEANDELQRDLQVTSNFSKSPTNTPFDHQHHHYHLISRQSHKFRELIAHQDQQDLEDFSQAGSHQHLTLSSSSSSSAASGCLNLVAATTSGIGGSGGGGGGSGHNSGTTLCGGHINSSSGSSSSKSKRVRTTFTEDQLSYLQKQFQVDSNPDGQDLERIATITGLSKRVTQVWFQNSRARQKKYLIKRKPGIGSSGTSSLGGVGGIMHLQHGERVADHRQHNEQSGRGGSFSGLPPARDQERRKWVQMDDQVDDEENEQDDDEDDGENVDGLEIGGDSLSSKSNSISGEFVRISGEQTTIDSSDTQET